MGEASKPAWPACIYGYLDGAASKNYVFSY